jgi:crotonobetainyl-CoA:carnitine CoA-transferase CaiB-like acyl-CoA transferase
VALFVRDDADWAHIVEAMGRPDLLRDSGFASAEQRRLAHDEFDTVVADWTLTQTAVDIVNALGARHVPAEQVLTPDRMYDIPQLDAREYYEEVEHPVTGPHRYPGWPFRMTPGPSRHHRSAPPTLGQHNKEVLRGLGLTGDELEELRARHVIGETALNA